jgi:hypothetical protein
MIISILDSCETTETVLEVSSEDQEDVTMVNPKKMLLWRNQDQYTGSEYGPIKRFCENWYFRFDSRKFIGSCIIIDFLPLYDWVTLRVNQLRSAILAVT